MSDSNHDNHLAVGPPDDKVVQLTDQIMKEGPKSADELERNRRITIRALEIAAKQLDRDALRFEESAIVGEHPIQRRHEMMDHARALRIAGGWLTQLTQPEAAAPPASGVS